MSRFEFVERAGLLVCVSMVIGGCESGPAIATESEPDARHRLDALPPVPVAETGHDALRPLDGLARDSVLIDIGLQDAERLDAEALPADARAADSAVPERKWRRLWPAYGHDSGACADDDQGALYCWGWIPEAWAQGVGPPIGTSVDYLFGGPAYGCALVDGRGTCWSYGVDPQRSLDAVSEETDLVRIVTSLFQACAFRVDGSAVCWGYGRATNEFDTSREQGQTLLRELNAGPRDLCLTQDGNVLIARSDGSVAEFHRDGIRELFPPGAAQSLVCGFDMQNWDQRGPYDNLFCIFGPDNRIACNPGNTRPLFVPEEPIFEAHPCGMNACGHAADGTLVCWGWNYTDEPDDIFGPPPPSWEPPPPGRFLEISCSDIGFCARREDRTIQCWGPPGVAWP